MFSPTPGSSTFSGTPIFSRISLRPIPDSSRSCGVFNELYFRSTKGSHGLQLGAYPADKTTSFLANALCVSPPCMNSTSVATRSCPSLFSPKSTLAPIASVKTYTRYCLSDKCAISVKNTYSQSRVVFMGNIIGSRRIRSRPLCLAI